MNPYWILGVDRSATIEQIRKAYRRLASRTHSDREGGDDEAMARINQARDILLDPARRKHFDETGRTDPPPPSTESKAQLLMSGMLESILSSTDVDTDIIAMMLDALRSQLSGCRQARTTCYREMAALDMRLLRLKGPPDNFIQSLIRAQIEIRKTKLPIYEADETVILKALQMCSAFSYEVPGVSQTASARNAALGLGMNFFLNPPTG